jgi:hypothetical protein
MREFSHRQAIKGEAKALHAFLQESRAYGQKRDLAVGVACIASGDTCSVFEDLNQNGSADAGEILRTYRLGGRITFGLPANPPALGPDGSAPPPSGVAGAWSNALVFPRDGLTGVVAGGFYLKQAHLTNYSVCMRSQGGSHRFDIAAWDGTSWRTL